MHLRTHWYRLWRWEKVKVSAIDGINCEQLSLSLEHERLMDKVFLARRHSLQVLEWLLDAFGDCRSVGRAAIPPIKLL